MFLCLSIANIGSFFVSAEGSVQLLSHIRLFVTSWTAVCWAFLSITNSWSLLKIMSIESVMPSNHLIFCHPHLLPPSVFASIRVFSSWFDILAIQGTLESSPTPQFKSINSSALSLFYGPTLTSIFEYLLVEF